MAFDENFDIVQKTLAISLHLHAIETTTNHLSKRLKNIICPRYAWATASNKTSGTQVAEVTPVSIS